MEAPKLARSYSDKYVPGKSEYDLYLNKNVDWFESPFLKFFYVGLIIAVWGILHVSQFVLAEDSWTVINMIHGVVSSDDNLSFELTRMNLDYIYYLSLDQRKP